MGNERYDISVTKEFLVRNKAKLLYVSSATYIKYKIIKKYE